MATVADSPVWITRLAPDAFGWALLAIAAVVLWLGVSVSITYIAAYHGAVDGDDPWEWAPAIVTSLLWPLIALALLVSFPWRVAFRRGSRRSRREAADL